MKADEWMLRTVLVLGRDWCARKLGMFRKCQSSEFNWIWENQELQSIVLRLNVHVLFSCNQQGQFTNPETPGYVGFANLPNQVHRKSVKKGFEFTLMVVGKYTDVMFWMCHINLKILPVNSNHTLKQISCCLYSLNCQLSFLSAKDYNFFPPLCQP